MTRSTSPVHHDAHHHEVPAHLTVRKIVHYVGSTKVRYADIALPRVSVLERPAC